MKPVDQTTFGFPAGNCLAASIASVTGLSLEPLATNLRDEWASGGHWLSGTEKVLGLYGYTVKHTIEAPAGYAVAFGPAARGFSHACVVLDGALAHDPHPSREGLRNTLGYLSIVPETVHRHLCAQWMAQHDCTPPCICRCGAVLSMGPTFDKDGRWAWLMPDGSFEEWK